MLNAFSTHYAQNIAGIIGRSLVCVRKCLYAPMHVCELS